MNAFDIVALASLVSAALNGYRQGLSREFYRLLRMAVALLTSTSLYSSASGVLTRWSDTAQSVADPVFFIGIAAAVWMLLRSLRKWIEVWIQKAAPKTWQATGGAIASAAKAAILLGGIVAAFNLATWIPGHTLIAKESVTSKVVRPFLSSPEETPGRSQPSEP
jgi:uncharacterized membrane protein required for colicin V production